MDSEFQFYDYTESFSNLRYQESKNSWAIPSDGSMESNEEYFWSNPLKLPITTSKQYINTSEANESIKFDDPNSENRKRKYFNSDEGTVKKIQVVEAMKDAISLSSNNLVQKTIDKRDQIQNGNRITSWTEDLTENLAAEFNGTFTDLSSGNYNVSEALLSLPSLTVFKQEAPSPTSNENPLQAIKNNRPAIGQSITTNEYPDSNNNQNSINTALQTLLGSGYNEIQPTIENGGIDDSSPQDLNRNVVTSSDLSEDSRFQYVLAAATSIATKVNEDTLTYLNQGQSYEIKLKKLGDLSNYRGRILKSVIRICFYERRLQYMEKEQMSLWQSSRPGDRIIEVDVPLSYGLREVTQPPGQLNAVHFQWDPTKEVGVYIKVNCISTEFTPKKHGGEKGVPFRIQVETYLMGDSMVPPKRLHAAACQIKVFKLKGADRKHKQDREKIMKRPPSEQEKYQRSYECTVLNDIPDEAIVSPPLPAINGVTSTVPGPYSPEVVPQTRSDFIQKIDDCPNGIGEVESPIVSRCPSNSNLLLPENQDDIVNAQGITLNCEFTVQQTSQWLSCNRFGAYLQTFAGFSGADMLRMSKDDLMQICGHADGIRLFNSLHSKSITPKLTLYVRRENASIFHAIYLMTHTYMELVQKLSALIGVPREQLRQTYYQGPHGIHVLINDDVVKHFKEDSMFLIEMINDNNSYAVILKPIVK